MSRRERGAGQGRSRAGEVLVVAAIVGVAALLRFAGLRWGLPTGEHFFSYHPDEIFLLRPSLGFAQGDWNPHFFNYGTLYIYLVGLPSVLLGLVPEATLFPAGMAPLHLAGRVITALLGTGTVLALYLALRRESRRLAALAAGLLALCPLHVVTSHYATVDVPATFWLTMAFLFALIGSEGANAKMGALAGLAVGLAAATKYNAALFIVPVFLAPVLAARPGRSGGWYLAVAAGVVIGFLIGCPFVGAPEFLPGVLFELQHMREGGTLAFEQAGSGWAYHAIRGLPTALGFPLAIAVICGVVAAISRPARSTRMSLLWVLLYLAVIGAARERFIRYLVPMMPFLCVLAASGMLWLVQVARRPRMRVAVSGLAGLVVLLTGLYSVGQVAPYVRPDPRDVAWREVGPRVYSVDSTARVGLVQTPWFYHPPVSPYNAGAFSAPLFEEWNQQMGERVVVTGWDRGALARLRPDYFFLSDLESADPVRLGTPEALSFVAELEEVYESRRVYEQGRPPFSWLGPGRRWAPPDWLYPCPRITLYYGLRE
jgi:hypothetical protein